MTASNKRGRRRAEGLSLSSHLISSFLVSAEQPVAPFGHSRPSQHQARTRALALGGRAKRAAERAAEKAAKHLSDPPSTLDALFAVVVRPRRLSGRASRIFSFAYYAPVRRPSPVTSHQSSPVRSGWLPPAYRGTESTRLTPASGLLILAHLHFLCLVCAQDGALLCYLDGPDPFFVLLPSSMCTTPHHPCMAWSAFFLFFSLLLGRSWMTMDTTVWLAECTLLGRQTPGFSDKPRCFVPLSPSLPLSLCASRSR